MRVERIELENVRNIRSVRLAPSPGLNFIHGRNGQGKTNLVEAIHFLATLDFHRGGASDFILRGEGFARVKAKVESEELHRRIEITIEKRRTRIILDGDPVRKSSGYLGKVLSVAFFPEDMLLLLMEPALRRKWMDSLISLYHIPYAKTVRDAKKALEGRNRLLRDIQPPTDALLSSVDAVLAPLAAEIMLRRAEIMEMVNTEVGTIYSGKFSGTGDSRLEYIPSFDPGTVAEPDSISTAYLEYIGAKRDRDIAAGATLSGPHRDDFAMTIDGKPVRTFASRGEVRTALLSLNFAKLEILRRKYSNNPIVILDDILSELDPDRRAMVMNALPPDSQVFITSTERENASEKWAGEAGFWHVESGNVVLEKS